MGIRTVTAILLAALACRPVFAQDDGGAGRQRWTMFYSGATRKGEAKKVVIDVTLGSLAFTNGTLTITPATSVTLLGALIGDSPADFADPVLFDGRQVDMSAATWLKIPVQTGTQPTTDGITRLNDDLDRVEVGSDSARTLRFMPGYQARVIGGTEGTATFTYAGEVSTCSSLDTGCSRTICRCGQCSGSEGSGTCALGYNSSFGRGQEVTPATTVSTVLTVKSFSHTAGTITQTYAASTSNVHYLVIRVREDAAFTAGTLSTKGKNSTGTVGGTRLASTAGRAGGLFSEIAPFGVTGSATGAGGSTAPGAGAAGIPLDLDAPTLQAYPAGFMLSVGSGGGGAPVTGNAAAATVAHPRWGGFAIAGAGGGGGGGCTSGTSGSSGAGGAGGAGILIEVGGRATFGSTYVINAMGDDGGANAGGGGGGGVQIIAGEISGTVTQDTGTCTASPTPCCVGGGAGGASGGNCGAGGAGADNICIVQQAPK